MLSYTHAGLYYVYYIVAEFLAFLDDIHIHGTDGVGIEMVVYIVDVLALQLIGRSPAGKPSLVLHLTKVYDSERYMIHFT